MQELNLPPHSQSTLYNKVNVFSEPSSNIYQNSAYTPNSPIIEEDEELIREKEKKIKSLKRKLKAYEENAIEQAKKLSNHDNLIIEYNSLNKNYTDLENELNKYKIENSKLNEQIKSKNLIICQFQQAVKDSTEKFKLFDDTNKQLKNKNVEIENRLKSLPELCNSNNDLTNKITQYEYQISILKNDNEKKDSLYKNKIDNLEKINKSKIIEYESELKEIKNEYEKLKKENEKIKMENRNLNNTIQEKELLYKSKLSEKETENGKLINNIKKLKYSNLETSNLSQKNIEDSNKVITKLEKDIYILNKEIEDKNNNINRLNEYINEYEKNIKEFEKRINNQENEINLYKEENEKLSQLINDKQLEIEQYQNESHNHQDNLNKKIVFLSNEKNNYLKNINLLSEENKKLNFKLNEINKNSKKHLEKCRKIDVKYNEMAKILEKSNVDFITEKEKLNLIIQKCQNENENIKNRYEKKNQMLKIENAELNQRIQNLISTLINLKDYALSIERNMSGKNEGYDYNRSNSCYNILENNLNSLNKEMSDDINYNYDVDIQSKELISGMKNLIEKIDEKLLYDDNLKI